MTPTEALHVAIVLDRSGSMSSCRSDAIGAVSSYVRSLRQNETTVGASLTLVLFDSDGIDTVRDTVPVTTCPELLESEYVPRAMTPLLDAVGRTAAALESQGEPGDRRILAIMTDGLENASREFTLKTIAALLKRKQDEGWLVAYLGANQNSWQNAERLGIRASSTSDFTVAALGDSACVLAAISARYVAQDGEVGFTEEERLAMMGKSEPNDGSKSAPQ